MPPSAENTEDAQREERERETERELKVSGRSTHKEKKEAAKSSMPSSVKYPEPAADGYRNL
jgi:hypothetical protein